MTVQLAPVDLMLRETTFVLGKSPRYADFALLGIVEALTFGDYGRMAQSLKALTRWRR